MKLVKLHRNDTSITQEKRGKTPVAKPELILEALLAEVTEENLHREVDTGMALGSVVW